MKTLEQLYNEVMASDDLKAEFLETAKTKEGAKVFLEKYGCDADLESFVAFMKDTMEHDLTTEELASVAGGKGNLDPISQIIVGLATGNLKVDF